MGTVSPSRLSMLNEVSSPAAKCVGVVHGVRYPAASLVEASNRLKVVADTGSSNVAAGAAGTSTKVDPGELGSLAGQQGSHIGRCGFTCAIISPCISGVGVSHGSG